MMVDSWCLLMCRYMIYVDCVMANDTMTILRFNQASGCHGATCSARWTSRGTGSRAAQGAADRGTVSYCRFLVSGRATSLGFWCQKSKVSWIWKCTWISRHPLHYYLWWLTLAFCQLLGMEIYCKTFDSMLLWFRRSTWTCMPNPCSFLCPLYRPVAMEM